MQNSTAEVFPASIFNKWQIEEIKKMVTPQQVPKPSKPDIFKMDFLMLLKRKRPKNIGQIIY